MQPENRGGPIEDQGLSSACQDAVHKSVIRYVEPFWHPKLTIGYAPRQPVYAGQTKVTPEEAIGQPRMIEAEQVQDRRVQVVDVQAAGRQEKRPAVNG